jgi:hypothetical protein
MVFREKMQRISRFKQGEINEKQKKGRDRSEVRCGYQWCDQICVR